MPPVASAEPGDHVFVVAPVRIDETKHRGKCFIPFCLDEGTLSNAVGLPRSPPGETHAPLSGLVLHHRGRCQHHAATSSVLGTARENWQWAKAELRDSLLSIVPLDDALDGTETAPPSISAVAAAAAAAANASNSGRRRRTTASSIFRASSMLLRRRSSSSASSIGGGDVDDLLDGDGLPPRQDYMPIGAQSSLLISRREPRLLGVLEPSEDRILLFHAPTPQEGLRWVATLAACIMAHRVSAPSRAPLFEVQLSREGGIGFKGQAPTGVPPAAKAKAKAAQSRATYLLRLGVPAAAAPPQFFLRDPSDVSRQGPLEMVELVHGRASVKRGLPPIEEDEWEVRDVQLEWFGMLVSHRWFAGRSFVNEPSLAASPQQMLRRTLSSSVSILTGGGGGGGRSSSSSINLQSGSGVAVGGGDVEPVNKSGAKIRIDFAAAETALYATLHDQRILALRHGPEDRLLLLRARTGAEARSWGHDLATCIAFCKGGDYVVLEPAPGEAPAAPVATAAVPERRSTMRARSVVVQVSNPSQPMPLPAAAAVATTTPTPTSAMSSRKSVTPASSRGSLSSSRAPGGIAVFDGGDIESDAAEAMRVMEI